MKTTTLLLAASLALGGGKALAQEAPNHALAEEVLVLMNLPQSLEQSLAAMRQAMPAQLVQMSKAMGEELPPEASQQSQQTMEILSEELRWEKMKDDYVALYATTFSADELKGLITFYQSPAGQAFVAKQPALMQASMALNQKLMLRVIPRLKEIYKKEAKKEGAESSAATAAPPAEPKSGK